MLRAFSCHRALEMAQKVQWQRHVSVFSSPLLNHQQNRSFFGLGNFFKKVVDTKKEDKSVVEQPPLTAPSNTAPVSNTKEEPGVVDASRKRCSIEYSIGKYARLADGSVMARWGDSMLLTTVVSMASGSSTQQDFLPLMVDYREKYSSTGMTTTM